MAQGMVSQMQNNLIFVLKELIDTEEISVQRMRKQVVMHNEMEREFCGAQAATENCVSADLLAQIFGQIGAVVRAHTDFLDAITLECQPAIDYYDQLVDGLDPTTGVFIVILYYYYYYYYFPLLL